MIGHTLRRGDELHSLTFEGMVERTGSRGRSPSKEYVGRVIQDAGVAS